MADTDLNRAAANGSATSGRQQPENNIMSKIGDLQFKKIGDSLDATTAEMKAYADQTLTIIKGVTASYAKAGMDAVTIAKKQNELFAQRDQEFEKQLNSISERIQEKNIALQTANQEDAKLIVGQIDQLQKSYEVAQKQQKKFLEDKITSDNFLLKAQADQEKALEKARERALTNRAKREMSSAYSNLPPSFKKFIDNLDNKRAERQELAQSAQEKLRNGEVLNKEEASANNMATTLKALENAFKSFAKAADSAFNTAETTYKDYQSEINARLGIKGNDTSTFTDIMQDLSDNFISSSVVKMSDIVTNVKNAVDKGIARDVESMAVLETIKDDIQSTFNAFDSNLLRVIRLQDANSTAARLGLESSLNDLFVKYFSDSTYLSDSFDSVTSQLVDAMAFMSEQQGAEFEYITQKWLGSLYSTGMSSNAVSGIAQGIAALATGDIDTLNSNSGLQNLLALSANRTGTLSYTDMLINGATSSQINELMKSMVEYLSEIVDNTGDNKVVLSQYGKTIGNLSISDMRAFSNLNNKIDEIYESNITYENMLYNTYSEAQSIQSRQHMSNWIDNVTSNLMYSTASDIVNSSVGYIAYKAADVVESLFSGAGGFSVMGTSMDLSSIASLAKTGIFGVSLIGNLLSSINGSSFTNGGLSQSALSLLTQRTSAKYTSYGNDDILSTSSGTTATVVVGSGDSYDAANKAIKDSYDSSKNEMADAGMLDEQQKLEDFEEDIKSKLGYLNDALFANPVTGDGIMIRLASDVTKTYERINSLVNSDKDYINVNISGLSLTDDTPIPIRFSQVGSNQLYNQLQSVTNRFGISADDDIKLKQLIDFLVRQVGATDEDGLNVYLKDTGIGMQQLLNNTAKSWNTYSRY